MGRLIKVGLLVLVLDLFLLLFSTILLDDEEYYGTKGTILKYDEIFCDFSGNKNFDYSYIDQSKGSVCDFADVYELYKDTEYEVLSRFEGRFLAFFNNRFTSCSKIYVIESDVYESEQENIEVSRYVSKAGYAEVFKILGNYYLSYSPINKDGNCFQGFSVCKILDKQIFFDNDVVPSPDNYIQYIRMYPSFFVYVDVLWYVKLLIVVAYAFQVVAVNKVIKNIRKRSRGNFDEK